MAEILGLYHYITETLMDIAEVNEDLTLKIYF